jgi:probable HAF family extracellular repeat protein
MRHPRKWQLAVVCLLTLSLLPFAPVRRARAQAAAAYTVTDIGTLGGTQSAGMGLDDCGRVVGESEPSPFSPRHPFFWDNGQLTDIGTFGGQNGVASAVNKSGKVAGQARNSAGDSALSSGRRPRVRPTSARSAARSRPPTTSTSPPRSSASRRSRRCKIAASSGNRRRGYRDSRPAAARPSPPSASTAPAK